MGFYIPEVKVQLLRERRMTFETNQIRSADDAAGMMYLYLEGVEREHFVVMLLNTKHKVIGINTVSIGILDASIVHPREVFKPAILAGASGIIAVHNHPSGDPQESPEDIKVTERLVKSGEILGIDVLDHIIIGDNRYVSLKAKGYL